MRNHYFLFILITGLLCFGCSKAPSIVDQALENNLSKAILLADRGGSILVTTIGTDGMPHMMVAKQLQHTKPGVIVIRDWSCPRTLSNLINQAQGNSRSLSIVVWELARDEGFQLLGNVVNDSSVENGLYEDPMDLEINVSVHGVTQFSRGFHSDL